MWQKEKLLVLSNFIFCHYVFKKPSAADVSESVYMRKRVNHFIIFLYSLLSGRISSQKDDEGAVSGPYNLYCCPSCDFDFYVNFVTLGILQALVCGLCCNTIMAEINNLSILSLGFWLPCNLYCCPSCDFDLYVNFGPL